MRGRIEFAIDNSYFRKKKCVSAHGYVKSLIDYVLISLVVRERSLSVDVVREIGGFSSLI